MKHIIMIMLLLIPLGLAQEETFDTGINISLGDGDVQITTESSEYSYDCNETRTVEKEYSIRRDIEDLCDEVEGCTQEMEELQDDCNEAFARIDILIKDQESYGEKYSECDNQLKKIKDVPDLTEDLEKCKEERDSHQSKNNACENDLSSEESKLRTCTTLRDTYKKEIDDTYSPWLIFIVGAVVGAGGLNIYQKRKTNPKSPQEETTGDELQ